MCLILNVDAGVSQKWLFHECIRTHPSNGKIHRNKSEYFTCNLQSHQAVFSKSVPTDEANAAAVASHKTTEILPKKKRIFEDGYVTKECLLVAGNSFKHKTGICNAIKEVQSSRCTVS
jgi:hypothetical protein